MHTAIGISCSAIECPNFPEFHVALTVRSLLPLHRSRSENQFQIPVFMLFPQGSYLYLSGLIIENRISLKYSRIKGFNTRIRTSVSLGKPKGHCKGVAPRPGNLEVQSCLKHQKWGANRKISTVSWRRPIVYCDTSAGSSLGNPSRT